MVVSLKNIFKVLKFFLFTLMEAERLFKQRWPDRWNSKKERLLNKTDKVINRRRRKG